MDLHVGTYRAKRVSTKLNKQREQDAANCIMHAIKKSMTRFIFVHRFDDDRIIQPCTKFKDHSVHLLPFPNTILISFFFFLYFLSTADRVYVPARHVPEIAGIPCVECNAGGATTFKRSGSTVQHPQFVEKSSRARFDNRQSRFFNVQEITVESIRPLPRNNAN